MKDFKKQIAKCLENIIEIDKEDLERQIQKPKDNKLGDYAFPCFGLAKVMKKAPVQIAEEIKEKLEFKGTDIEKIEIAGGYLNFHLKKEEIIKEVMKEIEQSKENYGKGTRAKKETILIDYSSPNIAKPFHIGHLRSTVIGGALYKIYEFLGYEVVGINHLGDYGTQFGKLIEGYKRWGTEYDIEKNPIEELTKIYVRINETCKENKEILECCRNNFKKLEEKDEYCTKVWEYFRKLSLQEFNKIYDILGSKFDSLQGEAFYSDKMGEVIEKLEAANKIVESQGARIVEFEDMPPCMIQKSNGSTTYATRDLAAILYRVRNYQFKKAIYLTSYEQNLHFKQIFEIAKYLGIDKKYTDNLIHVPFGMVLLKTGKMSTREGNIIKLEELLTESIERVKKIMEEKNPDLTQEEKQDISQKVGVGAVIFNDLSNSRIKDEIFDWDIILNFNGETGPYVQYTYVRTNSILKKAGYIPQREEIDVHLLLGEIEVSIMKQIYEFNSVIENAAEKNEPSILARYLVELAKSFSSFYNSNKIMVEDIKLQKARLYLTYVTNLILKCGTNLLGIQMPEKM